MKLTGDLKKKVEESASREEKKAAIEQAGMELTDDELDKVAGGVEPDGVALCPECGEMSGYTELPGGRRKCGACGRTYSTGLAGMQMGH